jgi:hypothetical protein
MKKKGFSLLLLLITAYTLLHAQDTLPRFSLKNVGNNRIIIGWTNTFENIRQISIQRSFDSLTGYKTILTVPDPTTFQNGYADTKPTNDHMFYRLYIMLDKGIFLFSNAKKPVLDTVRKIIHVITPTTIPATVITVTNKPLPTRDSLVAARPFVVKLNGFPSVTDSVAMPDISGNKPSPNAFAPSLYVYTFRDGYVRISLPENEKPKKYFIKFFEDNGTFLFELKDIKEKDFKIDKSNFYHAGWFRFELYEDGKLIEKHKFYLEKDF